MSCTAADHQGATSHGPLATPTLVHSESWCCWSPAGLHLCAPQLLLFLLQSQRDAAQLPEVWKRQEKHGREMGAHPTHTHTHTNHDINQEEKPSSSSCSNFLQFGFSLMYLIVFSLNSGFLVFFPPDVPTLNLQHSHFRKLILVDFMKNVRFL